MRPKIWVLLVLLVLAVIWLGTSLSFDRLNQQLILAALLGLLPLGFLLAHSLKRQKARLQALIEHPLLSRLATSAPTGRTLTQGVLWLAALACLIVALARPQGPPTQSKIEGQGLDILMALDISDSTKAQDEYPNRLQAAKAGIEALLPQLPGDRVGLLVFSGEAFPISPFTSDYGALQSLLAEVQHGLLPSATTDLAAGLQLARERFAKNKADVGKILIVFSDGENQMGSYRGELKLLSDMGARVFTVGLGNKQGARIPETNPTWGTLGYKTWQGEDVLSRLDDKTLNEIAKAGQGSYFHLDNLRNLPRALDDARGKLTTRATSSGAIVYQERYQAWLLLALLLLLIERLLPARLKLTLPQRRPPFAKILGDLLRPGKGKPSKAATTAALALVLLPLLNGAWDWPWATYWSDLQGRQKYEQKQYDQADKTFEQGAKAAPGNPDLLYNQGNSRYRGGKYNDAADAYRKSLDAPQATKDEKSQAWYNLGNSLFRKGQQGDKGEQTQADWQKAVQAYQETLKLNPRDTQAIENLNYVQEQLQQLQQQQQNQQGKNNQQNKQNQQQGQKGQQNQQGQNNQQNQQKDPQNQGQPQNQQGGQGGQNTRDPVSPYDNKFSKEEIQRHLDALENQERETRDQFQRVPGKPKQQDPFADPFGEGEPKDPNVKDW